MQLTTEAFGSRILKPYLHTLMLQFERRRTAATGIDRRHPTPHDPGNMRGLKVGPTGS